MWPIGFTLEVFCLLIYLHFTKVLVSDAVVEKIDLQHRLQSCLGSVVSDSRELLGSELPSWNTLRQNSEVFESVILTSHCGSLFKNHVIGHLTSLLLSWKGSRLSTWKSVVRMTTYTTRCSMNRSYYWSKDRTPERKDLCYADKSIPFSTPTHRDLRTIVYHRVVLCHKMETVDLNETA